MNRTLRQTINLIRDKGGTDITIDARTRHTSIRFRIGSERKELLIHGGTKVHNRFEPMVRSHLRRLGL